MLSTIGLHGVFSNYDPKILGGGSMGFAGLFVGLLIGWIFLPTPTWVCGTYNSNALPAWVQAIGSVAAILVAAWIPWWQERIKRKEEGRQLSIATLRLRSNLEVLGKVASDRAATMRTFRVEAATPSAIGRLLSGTNLTEARVVTSHVENVHHFEGRIQRPILQLLEEYDQYMAEHGRLYDTDDAEKIQQLTISKAGLITRLEQISQLSFSASNAIRVVDEEQRFPDLRVRNTFLRNVSRGQD